MKMNPAIKPFLRVYLFLVCVAVFCCISTDKGTCVLWANELNHPILDQFFKYLTFLGDGIFLVILCLVFCLTRYKYAIILSTIGIVQLILTYFLKKVVFGKTLRPAAYFSDKVDLHFVEGVDIHHLYSFPSGHTITAFSLFFLIALVNEKKSIGYISAIVASLIAFSRVYLVQHFLIDTVVGSAIGLLITGSVYYLAYYWQPFWGNATLNRPMPSYNVPPA